MPSRRYGAKYGHIRFLSCRGPAETVSKFPNISGIAWKTRPPTPPKAAKVKLRWLLSSLDNSLTLVAESEIHPFFKEEGRIKSREMRPHPLPWPTEALEALQNTEV